MPDESWKAYVFERLPSERSIRILQIEPGCDSTTISCHLETVDLDADVPPRYTALSYTWRDEAESSDIYVNQHRISIRSNLHQALERMRQPDKTRTVWIDALCINQADHEKIAAQVTRMANIFSLASQVVVWLAEQESHMDVERDVDKLPSPPHRMAPPCTGTAGTGMAPQSFAKEEGDRPWHLDVEVDSCGDWLLQTTEYQRWEQEKSRFLWMNGMTGCGKSILVKSLQASERCANTDPRERFFEYLGMFTSSIPAVQYKWEADQYHAVLHGMTNLMQRADKDAQSREYYLNDRQTVRTALDAIASGQWFKRPWVLQEIYCASRDVEYWMETGGRLIVIPVGRDQDLVAADQARAREIDVKPLRRRRSSSSQHKGVEFEPILHLARDAEIYRITPEPPRSPNMDHTFRRNNRRYNESRRTFSCGWCNIGHTTSAPLRSHARKQEHEHQGPAQDLCYNSRCPVGIRRGTKLVSGLLAVPQILAIREYAVAYRLAPPIEVSWMPEFKIAEAIWVPNLVGNWPWLVKPSPQLFLLCVVGGTAALRMYAYLSRADRYQVWFVALGMLSWPVVGFLVGMDLLAASLCVMPWTAFGSLLLSDVVHVSMRMLSLKSTASSSDDVGSENQIDEKDQMFGHAV
ncbi:hypothetical protein LTR86_009839 [Recurvomyces mirabilis]|nr:hypothetical protein LTR86_009839 [Recurvomyces mirabilis]